MSIQINVKPVGQKDILQNKLEMLYNQSGNKPGMYGLTFMHPTRYTFYEYVFDLNSGEHDDS